jgi:hypothetical protein
MSQYWQWMEHKGKRFLLVKFTGLNEEKAYVEAIADLEREILKQPKGRILPLVMDVSNTRVTKAVTDRGKQLLETSKAYGIPDSPAVLVGLSGAQKAIVMAIQLIRPDLHVAGSIDEAKDWLVKRVD